MKCTRCDRSVLTETGEKLAVDLYPKLSESDAAVWKQLYPDAPYPGDPPVLCWVCYQRGFGIAPDVTL